MSFLSESYHKSINNKYKLNEVYLQIHDKIYNVDTN